MEIQYFTLQKIGKHQEIIKLTLVRQADWPSLSQELVQIFDTCMRQNRLKIVINLERANHLPGSAIALLIEFTSRLRRAGGDLKLLKLTPQVIASMTAFNSANFVVRFETEEDVVDEFDELTVPAPKDALSEVAVTEPQTAPVFSPPNPDSRDKEQLFRRDSHQNEKPVVVAEESQNHNDWMDDTAPGVPSARPYAPKTVAGERPSIFETASPGDVWNMQNQNTEKSQLRARSTHDDLYRITEFVEKLAQKAGFPREEIGKMKVTVYEACLNIIEHAYHSDPDEVVVVQVEVAGNQFRITIQDWGERFDYDEHKPYDVARAVKERKTGGFGMYIIRRSMDAVRYVSDSVKGNRLMLLKYLPEN